MLPELLPISCLLPALLAPVHPGMVPAVADQTDPAAEPLLTHRTLVGPAGRSYEYTVLWQRDMLRTKLNGSVYNDNNSMPTPKKVFSCRKQDMVLHCIIPSP